MKYEEIQAYLQENVGTILVDFIEYADTTFGYKYPILEIENMYLYNYILENEFIDRSDYKMYYGEDDDYESYCRYPYIRLIVAKSSHRTDEELFVIHLNKTFFTSGHQKLKLHLENNEVSQGVKSWKDISLY